MDQDFAWHLLRQMVEIPSVSGEEEPLAKYLVKIMAEIGLHSYVDEAGNAIGEIDRGDGPFLLLLGHMDTVAGLVPVRQEGTLLYGRGSVDAKGALATFICAVADLIPTWQGGRLVLVGAVEEETPSSRGAHAILERYQPDAVLIGEPSGWNNVVQGYKGKIHFSYTVTCQSAHSAGPFPTASELGTIFWTKVVDHCQQISGGQSIFYNVQPTLLQFDGSMEQAQLEISCRIPPDFDIAPFQQALAHVQDQGKIEFQEITPAIVVERANSVIQALIGAIRQTGERPKLKLKTGTSDMNIVSQQWNVPMAAYGPGNSLLDHTPNEHIDLYEYLRAIAILSVGLRDLLGALQTKRSSDLAKVTSQEEQKYAVSFAPEDGYTPEEEVELNRRLEALGYLE